MKLQQLILNGLSLIFLAMAAYLIAHNWQTNVVLQGVNQPYPITLGPLLLLIAALAAGAIGCRSWAQLLQLGKQQKRTSRELERKDVSHEEAASQVKILEHKVQTLEKALREALRR